MGSTRHCDLIRDNRWQNVHRNSFWHLKRSTELYLHTLDSSLYFFHENNVIGLLQQLDSLRYLPIVTQLFGLLDVFCVASHFVIFIFITVVLIVGQMFLQDNTGQIVSVLCGTGGAIGKGLWPAFHSKWMACSAEPFRDNFITTNWGAHHSYSQVTTVHTNHALSFPLASTQESHQMINQFDIGDKKLPPACRFVWLFCPQALSSMPVCCIWWPLRSFRMTLIPSLSWHIYWTSACLLPTNRPPSCKYATSERISFQKFPGFLWHFPWHVLCQVRRWFTPLIVRMHVCFRWRCLHRDKWPLKDWTLHQDQQGQLSASRQQKKKKKKTWQNRI